MADAAMWDIADAAIWDVDDAGIWGVADAGIWDMANVGGIRDMADAGMLPTTSVGVGFIGLK